MLLVIFKVSKKYTANVSLFFNLNTAHNNIGHFLKLN